MAKTGQKSHRGADKPDPSKEGKKVEKTSLMFRPEELTAVSKLTPRYVFDLRMHSVQKEDAYLYPNLEVWT